MTDYGKAMADFERLSKAEQVTKLCELYGTSEDKRLAALVRSRRVTMYARLIAYKYDEDGKVK